MVNNTSLDKILQLRRKLIVLNTVNFILLLNEVFVKYKLYCFILNSYIIKEYFVQIIKM